MSEQAMSEAQKKNRASGENSGEHENGHSHTGQADTDQADTRDTMDGRVSGMDAIRIAKECLREFVGKECEAVSGLAHVEGGWAVTLEVVELERIPQTTDILGSYVVIMDHDGTLIGYERARRYARCQAVDGRQ